MQLSSVTGLWGITFLVTWFGSTFNWAIDRGPAESGLLFGLLAYSATWGLILLAGGARLAFYAPKKTVRVAAIGWPEGLVAMQDFFQILMPNKDHRSSYGPLKRSFCDLQTYFLESTRREARAGAKIILWPEINLLVFKEDEASFLACAQTLAREEQITVLMGIGSIQTGASRPLENKAVLVDAQGQIAYSYVKSRPVPGWESQLAVRGEGRIPTYESQYGRLGTAICYDLDFPQSIRQVGQLKVDTLLVPASDYEAIKNLHTQMAVFRAIENGCSMVRANRWGLSAAVDPLGRILAVLDDAAGELQVLVAQVPTAGVRTIYARFGDWFAWGCAAGLLWIVINERVSIAIIHLLRRVI
jgi:apolipoprotein N-acyltransferase